MLKSFTRSKKYKAVLRNSPAYEGGKQAGKVVKLLGCKYKVYFSEKQKKCWVAMEITFAELATLVCRSEVCLPGKNQDEPKEGDEGGEGVKETRRHGEGRQGEKKS